MTVSVETLRMTKSLQKSQEPIETLGITPGLPCHIIICIVIYLDFHPTKRALMQLKKKKKQEDERACIILVAFNFYCLQFRYIFFKHVTYLLRKQYIYPKQRMPMLALKKIPTIQPNL